jgi:hypothetical protein
VRRNPQDHAFHDADKAIGHAEVRGQRDDGHLGRILPYRVAGVNESQ